MALHPRDARVLTIVGWFFFVVLFAMFGLTIYMWFRP